MSCITCSIVPHLCLTAPSGVTDSMEQSPLNADSYSDKKFHAFKGNRNFITTLSHMNAFHIHTLQSQCKWCKFPNIHRRFTSVLLIYPFCFWPQSCQPEINVCKILKITYFCVGNYGTLACCSHMWTAIRDVKECEYNVAVYYIIGNGFQQWTCKGSL
jgi:hypothetical protein